MNETKDISKTGVFSSDNNVEIDYSSSSGIDSKRDSSDDNCSEIIENNLKLIVSDKTTKMNGDSTPPSPADIESETNTKPKQARFLVNNVGNDQKENNKEVDKKSEPIDDFNNDDQKFRSPVHSIIKKPSSEKQARFSVANVTKDEPSNVKFQEESSTTASPSFNTETMSSETENFSDNEDDHQKTHGSHTVSSNNMTYSNTQYFKSLRYYLTRDALPSESHYRNLLSIGENNVRKFSRPTLDELHENEEKGQLLQGQKHAQIVGKDAEEGGEAGEGNKPKGKVVKFGWLDGVYMRCLLNIWGVMLFLRLTWVVGQGGILQGLGVICLANVVTVVSAISMSAVCTNGQIKGGGIYYMISRSLGPEFGGAIGIMFTLANSIAVAMYIIGFCEALIDMLRQYMTDFDTIVGSMVNDVRMIGCITLVFILVLAIVGMDWVTRVQLGLLGLLIVSQLDFIIGSFIIAEDEKPLGVVGYNATVFVQNLQSSYHDYKNPDNAPSFFSVFGVFFPAVTGIVAGANLSGDLKDPAVAIPKGTLLAILTTFITYIGYGLIIGATTVPNASGNVEEYNAWRYGYGGNISENVSLFTDCDRILGVNENNESLFCEYGSANDQQNMAKISFTGYLIFAGCFAATLSSAIASLVGAPRVLQALAKDNLYPGMAFFAKGQGANNDPFRGYVLVFLISFGCILIAELDVVSSLLSNFFVCAYALINFSVFHASITKSPGWRPSFKYYNPWVALLGTVLCIAVMFLMDPVTALITFGVVAVLYLYISYRKPEANWGSSTQAQQFVTALKNVQSLNDVPDHVKNYRPKLLLFSGVPGHRQPLVDFGYLITKKLSLMICSHIETESTSKSQMTSLRRNVDSWLKEHNIRAFFSVTQDESFSVGAKSCMNLVGLGKLSPNMVMLGFKGDWQKDIDGLNQYIDVVHHGFDVQLAMGILRLSKGCDFSHVIAEDKEEEDASTKNGAENDDKAKSAQVKSKAQGKKTSNSSYHGVDGNPLSKDILADITQFQDKKRTGTIDVWWLYDDGGLTLLLPYILTTRAQFSGCSLRVFALANKRDELDRETRNMISLLSKFRIDYSDVTIIPDVTKKAKDSTKSEFNQILEGITQGKPDDAELMAHKEKTNRHLRLAELLRENSAKSEMVIMTLPMPRRGGAPPTLYMSWLEMITRQMPPFLLLRGNQTSVLTFYS